MHPDIERARAEARIRDEAAEEGSSIQPQIEPYRETTEAAAPVAMPAKRPVGRPRKDGTPPRNRLAQAKEVASQKKAAREAKKPPQKEPEIVPVAPPPAHQRHIPAAPFDWANAPLQECSRRLKWLQDEAAAGVTAIAQRTPREEFFRCWCHSEHAKDNGKRPPCFDPSHEKMGPDQKIVRPVSTQTVRIRDFAGGPERLTNIHFGNQLCLAYYQKKVYGLHDLPIMSGR